MGRFGVMACVVMASIVSGDEGGEVRIRERAGSPLAVRIVPNSYRERTGRAITGRFHVVVTNVSAREVRLWRDWCSWGYFNLSFELTRRDGTTVILKRKSPGGWDKNYPDFSIVPPGDHIVLEVSFQDSTWQDLPVMAADNMQRVRLKAVYEVPADEQTEKHGVWTGRATSPEETYMFFR